MEAQEKKKIVTEYQHISMFDKHIREYSKRKMDFLVEKTTYSRIIKTDTKKILFNSKGKRDDKMLYLLNKTRQDAKMFLDSVSLMDNSDEFLNISNIDFFQLYEIPNKPVGIAKVDLRSAYWKYALSIGLIQKETDEKFKQIYEGRSSKDAKEARLKALGSLATTKTKIPYVKGKADYDREESKTEETKPLYMLTCKGVDDLMKECQRQVKGVMYYYWDCIFIKEEFSQQAIDFFESQDYSVSVGFDEIRYKEIGGNHYIVSSKEDNCYMVRKEDNRIIEMQREGIEIFSESYNHLFNPYFK